MTADDPASVVIRHVQAVRDAKITSVREYTDTQHVERVLFGRR